MYVCKWTREITTTTTVRKVAFNTIIGYFAIAVAFELSEFHLYFGHKHMQQQKSYVRWRMPCTPMTHACLHTFICAPSHKVVCGTTCFQFHSIIINGDVMQKKQRNEKYILYTNTLTRRNTLRREGKKRTIFRMVLLELWDCNVINSFFCFLRFRYCCEFFRWDNAVIFGRMRNKLLGLFNFYWLLFAQL